MHSKDAIVAKINIASIPRTIVGNQDLWQITKLQCSRMDALGLSDPRFSLPGRISASDNADGQDGVLHREARSTEYIPFSFPRQYGLVHPPSTHAKSPLFSNISEKSVPLFSSSSLTPLGISTGPISRCSSSPVSRPDCC